MLFELALARAGAAVIRLDRMIEQMRRDGTLREFNVRYQRGRAAAAAAGQGFMTYAAATARLALIPLSLSETQIRLASEAELGDALN